eukprot:12407469-Alexandrium_andersonii.AAC.1
MTHDSGQGWARQGRAGQNVKTPDKCPLVDARRPVAKARLPEDQLKNGRQSISQSINQSASQPKTPIDNRRTRRQ